jgi:fatty acid desaturase
MQSRNRAAPDAFEWPTLALGAAIYGGWITVTLLHRLIPPALLAPVGGWLIAWQGSLQHETIHGHPTRWPVLNRLIGFAPLSLWLPYEAYRRSHLAHHATDRLTDPSADPESRYLAQGRGIWAVVSAAQSTLLGRLLIGPPLEVGRFLSAEARALALGDWARWRIWGLHMLAVGVVLAWLKLVCGLSLGDYLLFFVYPGIALSLLRSFAEHRADEDPARRVATVEGATVLGLLFLNNNLHATHHANPAAPWWRLPALYAAQRPRLVGDGAPVYAGYAEVLIRFLLRAHDGLQHPQHAAPANAARALAG